MINRKYWPGLIVVALAAVVLVATQIDSHRVPMGTVLYGVLYGSLSGLLAIGLVLIYRVSRAINFAYGSMGGVAGAAGVSLYLGDHHLPWGVTIAIALIIGGLVGAAVGALINWRFSNTPRMILTVATVGLSQLLGGITAYEPRWFGAETPPIGGFQTGLSRIHTEINPVLFTGNELLIVIIVPAVVAAVSWFLLRTDTGRAVRAIADNSDRARLIGIPARRLLLIVWTISGVVAALAIMLQAPDQGVAINAAAGPTLLLAPLAVAVVAKMESLWVAFITAIGLGVLQSVIQLDVSKLSVSTVVFLVVVMLALLVQHRSQSRADSADESSWSVSGAIKPIPVALRKLREVRAFKIVVGLALAALAISLPSFLTPGRLDQVSVTIVFGMVAVSLVVLSGWSGTISLGQFALVGVGAITAGDLMMHFNVDFFFALAAGGLVAAAGAVILGLPALRVRGLYLAVTTLAFAVAADEFLFNAANFNSILPSSVLRPVLWQRFNLHGEGDLYALCLGMLILTIALVSGVRRARFGRAVLATRDNLRGAEAAAVPTTRVRLAAFAMSGLIAGVAGGLYVVIVGTASSTNVGSSFPSADSLILFSMAVIGGLTSVGGALTGVALIQWIGIAYPNVQILLTGTGLLVVLTIFPGGLAGVFQNVRDRVLVVVARRHGIDVSVWGDGTKLDERAPATEAAPTVVRVDGSTMTTDTDEHVLLRCRNVNASYGSMQVLFGIDFTVREGEMVALLGTNGAGKSSLLKSITGLLPAHEGAITFYGHDITGEATERIVGRGVTMMPGGRGVFASLTVTENLRVASWPLRKDHRAAEQAREEAMNRFPILRLRAHTAAGNLSGGEQQMLSLAMAFLVRPRLLCIDELSLGLAPTVVAPLIEAVKEIHRQGTTVIIVEQSVQVALLVAQEATFLEKGQVRFSGPSSDLLDRPDLLRAVFIGGESPAAAAPTTNGVAPPTKMRAEIVESGDTDEPALVVTNLVKRFGGIVATNDLSLSVAQREIVGLIGHNGAGKTTLFDQVSGFLSPDSGAITLRGIDVTTMPSYVRSIGGLGRSFQEARLFPTLSVAETIKVALERHLVNRDPFAAAFRLPASTDSEANATERVDEIVTMLGLGGYRDRATGELSTGTRRIVELACILAHRPALLLLDEPTAGVAQAETEALGPLLRTVAAETGCAMMVIAHDMALISSLCDRLVALELGSIIADGTPTEVLADPAVIASYLGTEEPAVAAH